MALTSSHPFNLRSLPRIVSAKNDTLIDETGHTLIDLFSAHGTTFLGHAHPAITAAVMDQLQKVWLTGGLPTPALDRARELIDSLFPETHHLAALYSTGMEAAEYAMRLARVATGKSDVIGFEGSMHGKSLATASLGWPPTSPSPGTPGKGRGEGPAGIHRIAFIANRLEPQVLEQVERTLRTHPISAIFLEPLQASSTGLAPSADFLHSLHQLCRDNNTLLVFDELLTGLHRLGPPFFFYRLDFTPDLILLGKSLANGFPVSAVVARKDIPIDSRSLPGSTFSSNPLSAASVAATLTQMRAMDLPAAVARLESIITAALDPLRERNIVVRGQGLLWVLPDLHPHLAALVSNLYRRGVFVSHTPALLRILPPATISPENLHAACTILCDEILRATNKA